MCWGWHSKLIAVWVSYPKESTSEILEFEELPAYFKSAVLEQSETDKELTIRQGWCIATAPPLYNMQMLGTLDDIAKVEQFVL